MSAARELYRIKTVPPCPRVRDSLHNDLLKSPAIHVEIEFCELEGTIEVVMLSIDREFIKGEGLCTS